MTSAALMSLFTVSSSSCQHSYIFSNFSFTVHCFHLSYIINVCNVLTSTCYEPARPDIIPVGILHIGNSVSLALSSISLFCMAS